MYIVSFITKQHEYDFKLQKRVSLDIFQVIK